MHVAQDCTRKGDLLALTLICKERRGHHILLSKHVLGDFTLVESLGLSWAIDIAVPPDALLLVFVVVADLDTSIRPLNQGWSLQNTVYWCELSEIAVFRRVRLDYSLLAKLLPVFESTHLQDLVLGVDKKAEPMGIELACFVFEVVAPESVVFELTVGHNYIFNKSRFIDWFVVHKNLHVEGELLVLVDAESHILVRRGSFTLNLRQSFNLLLNCLGLHDTFLGAVELLVAHWPLQRLPREGRSSLDIIFLGHFLLWELNSLISSTHQFPSYLGLRSLWLLRLHNLNSRLAHSADGRALLRGHLDACWFFLAFICVWASNSDRVFLNRRILHRILNGDVVALDRNTNGSRVPRGLGCHLLTSAIGLFASDLIAETPEFLSSAGTSAPAAQVVASGPNSDRLLLQRRPANSHRLHAVSWVGHASSLRSILVCSSYTLRPLTWHRLGCKTNRVCGWLMNGWPTIEAALTSVHRSTNTHWLHGWFIDFSDAITVLHFSLTDVSLINHVSFRQWIPLLKEYGSVIICKTALIVRFFLLPKKSALGPGEVFSL